mmetsp:Transcript_18003/g.44823  ORF Transcript_18003/g.44823 Transcript_18003/m.44823 type:complete len:112 (-) Transcript_18003:97-432(-)
MGVLLIMACFFCTPFFILRLLSGEISIDQVQDTIKRARLLNRICPAVACTEEDEGTACYVCCEKLVRRDACRVLGCGHCFHATCLEVWWLRRHPRESFRCPVCRHTPNSGW